MQVIEVDSGARRLLTGALAMVPPRLDLVAIAIGQLGNPALEPATVTTQLDALGQRVRGWLAEVAAEGPPPRRATPAFARALAGVLGGEEGLGGRTEGYDEPSRSFIQDVLATRVGLPIALSVIYVEVARRAGIALYGIGFPGHFLCGADVGGEVVVLDPFHGGRVLGRPALEALLARFSPGTQWSPGLLAPAPVPTIAVRMLTNLKHAFEARKQRERLLETLTLLLAVMPDHPGELRARAELLSELGASRAALADYRRCLEVAPEAEGRAALAARVHALEGKLGASS